MVSEGYIDSIYSRLGAMDVSLDPNPIEYGPARLNEKTSEVRGYLSSTESIFMEVSHNLHKYKRDLLALESAKAIGITRLMAEDPHVRTGRSQGEREALASLRLEDENREIDKLKIAVAELDEVMKVIKAKRSDLKDLQGRLRDQLKLCQEQISLGQRWGSKATPRKESVLITSNPEVRDNLDEIFEEALSQARAPEEESPEEKAAPDEVEDFFSADVPESGRKDNSEIDLDEILNDFLT